MLVRQSSHRQQRLPMSCGWVAIGLPLPRKVQQRRGPDICSCSTSSGPANSGREERRGIVAENLSLWWPNGTPALRNVSLHVPPGTLAMVAGANGSGKSTLLAALRRLWLPDLGSVHADAPCAFVYQDPQKQLMFPSVAINLAVSVPETLESHPDHLKFDEQRVRKRVLEGLERVGFSPAEPWMSKRSRELSGGEGQRVAVAAALLMQPKSIMFDEVTASMDAANKMLLLGIIPPIVKREKIAALWFVVIPRCQFYHISFVFSENPRKGIFEGRPKDIYQRLSAQKVC